MVPESLGAALDEPGHWDAYNEAVRGRSVRQLCVDVLRAAGPGAGRTAVDLGCGTGTEAKAMLEAGWDVVAVDGASRSPDLVRQTVGDVDVGRLRVWSVDITQVPQLPDGDLVFSSLTLPFLSPVSFDRVWPLVVGSVRPQGWLAVNFLGERDGWAPTSSATFLTASAARSLLAGLELVKFEEWEQDRPAYRQDLKHWHVIEAIARRPPASTPDSSTAEPLTECGRAKMMPHMQSVDCRFEVE